MEDFTDGNLFAASFIVAENIDFFPIAVKQKPNRKPIRFG
jgi:hypothetical protein